MKSKHPLSAWINSRFAGLMLTFAVSIILLVIFYGKILLSLNTTFFSVQGDGIQSYYNSYYLAKYDTSLMYSRSMNYPHGDVAFYTLSQPLVVGVIRFISDNFADITGKTVGIINLLMLSSVLLAAIFLYLFLAETGLPAIFSLPVSVGIAFLSPQIDRFGGHYTLAYVTAIPLLLYLLIKFHKTERKTFYSMLTGFLLFFFMTGHVYYAFFYATAILFYWFYVICRDEPGKANHYLQIALHITLQLILPVLAYYLITSHYAGLSPDKPAKPYGFLVYKASPESVLLPLWVDYGKFLHKIRSFNYVQWEGVAYIGLTASIGFFIILAGVIHKIYSRRWKTVLQVSNNNFLNAMFWASFCALLYSFGIPFILGLDFLIDYIGPFRQMRAIGRFSWLFFYVTNLVVFYNLWQWHLTSGRRSLKSIVPALAILILAVDVYFYLKNKPDSLNNHFPAWSDMGNISSENRWVADIDPDYYQAIIPLPYYHMGSDNYGIDPRCEMLTNSFLVSMKTGLPITAIYLSRASVSQSLKNISLVLEPYRKLEFLEDVPDKRPFLVVAGKCSDYSREEQNLLLQCNKVDSAGNFYLYSLDFDSLLNLPEKYSREVMTRLKVYTTGKSDTSFITGPNTPVIRLNFNDSGNKGGYRGNSMLITGRSGTVLFDGPLHTQYSHADLILSFWFSPIQKDLYPKTRIEMGLFNNKGEQYHYQNTMLGQHIKTVDRMWGLIECSFQLANPGDHLRITIYNDQIGRKQAYFIDEFLIRPDNCDVYELLDNTVIRNDRLYYRPASKRAINDVPGI